MNEKIILHSILFSLIFILYILIKREAKNNEVKKSEGGVDVKSVKNNYLIIISFYSFTVAQKNRWMNISRYLPIVYKLLFVTESCKYIEELKPYEVFCFTRNDFIREFPLYKSMGGNCQNQQPGFYMWSMWLESVLHSIKRIYKEYRFIWIIEGDVGYSGDINMLFRKYDNIYSDLISLPIDIYTSKKDWCWYDCCTKEYKEWIESIAHTKRLVAAINIVRLSPNLINSIMYNLKANRHSHCESTLLETAKYNNLVIILFNKSDLGEKIRVGDRVSVSDWKNYNNDLFKQNKLYHALKF